MDKKSSQALVLPKSQKTALLTYSTGFLLSLALTLVAYQIVQAHINGSPFTQTTLIIMVAGLAITQLLVQLVFFLHVGTESKPRWNLMMLLFAGMVITILVGGSLWIMYGLDYHMGAHNTQQINRYMDSQDGL